MRFVALLVVSCLGCTEVDNPKSCVDGSCSSSKFPFCDVEGLSDEPRTCIAVDCEPGSFRTCRGERAITCNATGDNFDLVECPYGCGLDGCNPPPNQICVTNDQCTNPAPICGAEMTCRGCNSNDECSSTVCELDTGACTAEAAIVYAAPAGATTGNCTLSTPCSLTRATMVAWVTIGKTLRMLPGTYSENLNVVGNVILKVVGDGATLADTYTMSVTGGATVDVRNLILSTPPANPSSGVITCGDQSTSVPKSTLRWQGIDARLRMFRCNATMVAGTLRGLSISSDESSLDADGVRFPFQGGYPSILGTRQTVRFVNSIFEDVGVYLGTSDVSGSAGSTLTVAFSTFVFTSPSNYIVCDANSSGYQRTERFENNIIYAAPSTASNTSVLPRSCLFANNIMFPQSNPIPGNLVADPKFIDVPGKNYRLMMDSPAINAGIPSTGLSTTHDFDGVARPQGAAHDIGAFELVP